VVICLTQEHALHALVLVDDLDGVLEDSHRTRDNWAGTQVAGTNVGAAGFEKEEEGGGGGVV
jgi:hypothetical protein